MKTIPGVGPGEYVGNRFDGRTTSSLHEKVCRLMAAFGVAHRRGVGLREYDVTCDAKASAAPRGEEAIRRVVSVETHAEGAILEDAVHLGVCGPQPRARIVIENGTA